MSDPVGVSQKSSRGAGNKAKLIGAKPPLSPRHVWSIRTRMQLEGRIRDNHRIVLGGPRQYADPSNTRRLLRAGISGRAITAPPRTIRNSRRFI